MDIKIFTNNIEGKAKHQVYELAKLDVFKDSKIRIMPDVHAGAGCVIGFTADLGNKVIPNVVGVDIGCGMYTVPLGNVEIDFKLIDTFINDNIPSGREVNEDIQVYYEKEIMDLHCLKEIGKTPYEYNLAIGSLGGGNHFIEIAEDENKSKFLIIHSGSRNMGYRVAKHYQNLAIKYHKDNDNVDIIKQLKKEGRHKEIQNVLKSQTKINMPKELAYLETELREMYLHDMAICQKYAEQNRVTMADKIMFKLGLYGIKGFQTIHNYIDFEDNIVRKGAIKADKGTVVLIPINMRDGSILAIGKGNDDWNNSAPHGAGRLMSRRQAKDELSLKEYQDTMKDVYSTSVDINTLDEAPMAYKSMQEILDNIGDTVDVISILKPVYNFKAN